MDSEAAVLRAEMSRTRAELDQKLTQLQARVSELTPKRVAERYMPDYFVDRAIGGVLTLVGLRLAWGMYRKRSHRREQLAARLAAQGSW